MELHEKEEENAEKYIGKLFSKKNKGKSCLLTLDVKPFRSEVKGSNSAGKKLYGLPVRGKKLLI